MAELVPCGDGSLSWNGNERSHLVCLLGPRFSKDEGSLGTAFFQSLGLTPHLENGVTVTGYCEDEMISKL